MEQALKKYFPIFVLPTLLAFLIAFREHPLVVIQTDPGGVGNRREFSERK